LSHHNRNLDEHRRKAEVAQARLVRHEKLSRVALLLVLLLALGLLALVVSYLRGQP